MSGPLPDFQEYRTVVVNVNSPQPGIEPTRDNAENTDATRAEGLDVGTTPSAKPDETGVNVKGEDDATSSTQAGGRRRRKKGEPLGVLEWSGYPAGGLINDIKSRGPYYITDWTDAFTKENLSIIVPSVLFLFFACFAPALAFGAIFNVSTDGQFGITEMILSTAISGIVYAIFSGQPLTIMGATGPELAYTIVFFDICNTLGLEFLPARFWQGMWTALFTVLLAVSDSCCLMNYVTAFTEEVFSALISLLEIIAAAQNIITIFLSGSSVSASLLSLLLSLFTYGAAVFFRDLKATDWLTAPVRRTLSNYGVIISILMATIIAAVFVPWAEITDLAYLNVPETFAPTWINPKTGLPRDWVINPFGINEPFPVWGIFFTALPALGLTLLGYLDQNLTEVLVNRADRKLKKPPGYHLDLFTCGAFIYPPCSLLGLQFTHAATVRSLAHLLSLTHTEVVEVDGGKRSEIRITGVAEQRFTHLIIHVLIALSLLATPVLRLVPRPIIIGIFLYLGTSSIRGNKLFDRLFLLAVCDRSRWPNVDYVTKVDRKVMTKWTLVQLASLVLLVVLARIPGISVVFPFLIGALIPFRKVLNKFFTPEDLRILDR